MNFATGEENFHRPRDASAGWAEVTPLRWFERSRKDLWRIKVGSDRF